MCAPRKCVFSWVVLPAALALLLTACGGPPPAPDILVLDEYASGDEQAAPQGIEVFFRVEGGGDGSSVKHGCVVTHTDGRAITPMGAADRATVLPYLESAESALIPAQIHAVNDAERLGDHAESMVELQRLLAEGAYEVSPEAFDEIREIQACLNKQFEAIFVTLEGSNPRGVGEAIQQGKTLTSLVKKCTEQHVHRLEIGKCHVQAGVIYLDALGHLERVGDHLVNIAERAGTILEVTSA